MCTTNEFDFEVESAPLAPIRALSVYSQLSWPLRVFCTSVLKLVPDFVL